MIENKVYPIELRHRDRIYLTLYYYTADSDALLHDGRSIIFFTTADEMCAFCKSHSLLIEGETAVYDFDAPIENPIDYSQLLNRWNLLDTISETLSMYFEGKRREYDRLYDTLFRCSTCRESIPPEVYLSKKDICGLKRVFKRQARCFRRFEPYQTV